MDDHAPEIPWREETIVRSAGVPCGLPRPLEALGAALGPGPFALVTLFVSPAADFDALIAEAGARFGTAQVVACTTAGEIFGGYTDSMIVALALPERDFACTALMTDLDAIDSQAVIDRVLRARASLEIGRGGRVHEFAMMLVDGLSLREDPLAAAIGAAMGQVPVFGGSAGNGADFGRTLVACNGRVAANAGVVALVASRCPARVFSIDHLRPCDVRMVVTSADPARRIVHTINAEPAAREYARLVGKDPGQLDPFTFAAHPVVVRFGDRHHVRAIQRVTPGGDLVFFSAIDEGLVLRVAEPGDLPSHLEAELGALGAPTAIVGFDCILRRIEARDRQVHRDVSRTLARHGVVGFSTYGEQVGAMHVNQTMTGIAIYPPDGP